ncbi:hypothetical protein CMI42_02395 [Candidatus Pacearchaeota archaeon]|nr:hypothetical protein [Candidatus Pacearchaeota archaeon]|tara:strand:- start:554 stop:802 length:249 start_codon:yes stop_codon:yes gene_type:complete
MTIDISDLVGNEKLGVYDPEVKDGMLHVTYPTTGHKLLDSSRVEDGTWYLDVEVPEAAGAIKTEESYRIPDGVERIVIGDVK